MLKQIILAEVKNSTGGVAYEIRYGTRNNYTIPQTVTKSADEHDSDTLERARIEAGKRATEKRINLLDLTDDAHNPIIQE